MSSSLVSQTGKSMERRQGITLTPRLGLAWWRDSTSSRNGRDASGEAVERDQGKTCELLTGIPELNENKASASTAQQWDAKPIEINGQDEIVPITFLAHGDYIIGGDGNKIRRWRVKDGKEVGQPMDAGDYVHSIAVSRDGRWIVYGTGRAEWWCGMRRATKKRASSKDMRMRCTRSTPHPTRRELRADRMTGLSVSGRDQPASNSSTPWNTGAGWPRSNSHPTDNSSPPPHTCASPFGSTTVAMAVFSLTVQSRSARSPISPSPGSVTASSCLCCHVMARFTVST